MASETGLRNKLTKRTTTLAKVTFTIEDTPDGRVKTIANPTFETMAMKINSGEDLTPAQGYAVAAINRIMEVSRNTEKTPSNIYIPQTMKKL